MAGSALLSRDVADLAHQRSILTEGALNVDLRTVSREEIYDGHTADWERLWRPVACENCPASTEHSISWLGDGDCKRAPADCTHCRDHGDATSCATVDHDALAGCGQAALRWASQLVIVSELALLSAARLAAARSVPVSEAIALYAGQRAHRDGKPRSAVRWQRVSPVPDFVACVRHLAKSTDPRHRDQAAAALLHIESALRARGLRGAEDPAAERYAVIVRAWPR